MTVFVFVYAHARGIFRLVYAAEERQHRRACLQFRRCPAKYQLQGRRAWLPPVSGEGFPRNCMILLGHRRLQYIGEEPLGVAGG